MKQQLYLVPLSLALMMMGLAPAFGQEAVPNGGKLTCNGPVSNKDTGESLYSRFGEDAGLDTFQDQNYNNFIEAELFAFGDAHLTVKFEDNDFVKNVAAVEIASDTTAWSVAGVKIGMSLDEVAAINGGPFKLAMTDYYLVADRTYEGGKLAALDGGCRLRIAFSTPGEFKTPQSVDRNAIPSDHPDVVKAHPVVSELSLSWPRK